MALPLHPTLVLLPLALGLGLAAVDVARLRWRTAELAWVALSLHGLLLGATLLASSAGAAEAGRIPTTPEMLAAMERHVSLGSGATFAIGATFLLRAATWKRRDTLRVPLAATSLILAALLLLTAHRGGVLVFEHGAGVRRPPWDLVP